MFVLDDGADNRLINHAFPLCEPCTCPTERGSCDPTRVSTVINAYANLPRVPSFISALEPGE